jgi:hypothetical protein
MRLYCAVCGAESPGVLRDHDDLIAYPGELPAVEKFLSEHADHGELRLVPFSLRGGRGPLSAASVKAEVEAG